MQNQLTTSSVRRTLEEFGAVAPGVRAVRMVAVQVAEQGQTRFWSLRFTPLEIEQAVSACRDEKGQPLRGESSYRTFAEALRQFH